MIARDYEIYNILFPVRTGITPGIVRELLEQGLETGWSTQKEGSRDGCRGSNYTKDKEDWVDLERLFEEFGTGDEGYIRLFAEEGEFDFRLFFRNDFEMFELPALNGIYMSTEYVHWKRDPAFATSAMFDAAICLFETLNAPFAFSYLPHEVEWGTPVTQTDLEQNTIPDVFWMTMLSAPTVEEIGRDRFDDLPVDRMRQLDNGGAAFAAVDDAFKGYTPEVKQRVRDYLEIGGDRKT